MLQHPDLAPELEAPAALHHWQLSRARAHCGCRSASQASQMACVASTGTVQPPSQQSVRVGVRGGGAA
eukprot:565362-Rhodomonas_salina.2